MLSHTFTSVKNFDRAYAFYAALFQTLGVEQRFLDTSAPWAGWQSAGGVRPLFLIGYPFNGLAHEAGNGQMLALAAPSRLLVDQTYATALAHGGICEGAPGLRPQYHAHYYGAYFRDTEGNKLCVACHDSIQSPS